MRRWAICRRLGIGCWILLTASTAVFAEAGATQPQDPQQPAIETRTDEPLAAELPQPTAEPPPDALQTPAAAAPDVAPPPSADDQTAAPTAPAPQKPNASELAAYLAAVEVHLERDPALAAAYTVFWSELREAARTGKSLATAVPETFTTIGANGRQVAAAVREHYRGMPPTYAASEALRVALLTLAEQPQKGRAAGSPAERLLGNLDRAVAPLVKVDGRYEHSGNLQRPADLGFGAEVWLLCRQSTACMASHDELFGEAMAGVRMAESVEQRLGRDALLAAAPQMPALLAAAADLDARLAHAAGPDPAQSARDVAGLAAREYWRAITAGVPLPPGGAGGAAGAPRQQPGVDGSAILAPDVYGLQALFTLGRAGAYLAGQDTLANVFAVTRAPAIDFATAVTQGALLGTLGSSAAGIGLLFAGVQALALFDGMLPSSRDAAAPAELRQLVMQLNDATYRSLQSARAEQLLATNAVDTRVAALGIALDVVKTDVARLETAARRRVGSDFQAAAARRWTAFDEDNERCFSLRNRDPRTGHLRASEFRRCEDRFLQGATRRSQYATRATEYVLDARFIEPGDPRFPFHDHYPLLASLGGLDSRAALALPDPLDWQQHAAALLRLYQENPARPGDHRKRHETLASVQAAGARTQQALLGLALRTAPDGAVRFREDVHRKALEDYFAALERLVVRVGALDDPAVHPYGKRLTEGLDQSLPAGAKRSAIEATLSGAASGDNRLGTCPNAPASAFEPQPDRLLAESRRFFGDPIQPAELGAAWNRGVVDAMALRPASFADLVPVPYLWAALEGLGKLEFCLAQFRPETVAFTRSEGPLADTLLGTTLVGAEVEVRFRPDPAVTAAASSPDGGTTVIARYNGERACTFGYRNDDKPCSRARCLPELVPRLWGDESEAVDSGARCEGESLIAQLPHRGSVVDTGVATPLLTRLADLYRTRQQARIAQLEADVLRSNEYEMASALYLKYYALAGVTLGTYPDGTDALGGLFGPTDALAPRDVVNAMIADRTAPPALLEQLHKRAETIQRAVRERGGELEATGRHPQLPHLRALEETLSRIDLAGAAYSGR